MAAHETGHGAIRVVLPGERKLDKRLIDEIIEDVKLEYLARVLEFHHQLGRRILDDFFDGDLAAFGDRGKKHVSYNKLTERLEQELGLKRTAVWYAVRLVEQFQVLPDVLASSLPMSHHRLLLHVPDGTLRLRLAEKAYEKGWSKRKLEAEIKKKRKKDGRGRKPLPNFVKTVHAWNRAFTEATAFDGLDDDSIATLDETEVSKLYSDLASIKKKCTELQDALQGQAAELTSD